MKPSLDQLLQQSNELKNQIEKISEAPEESLTRRPDEKSWCVLEVIDHLNKVYDIYLANFERVLTEAYELSDDEEVKYKNSLLGRMAIFSSKPKGTKRRFKMKTFDFFEPSPLSRDHVFSTFLRNKATFNELLKDARTKDVGKMKMPTALGEKYKLYVPECFAFVLAHEERHLVQMKSIIEFR